jgi:cobalt/nickel transport protein
MKPKDRNLIIVGVIICLVIAVAAPFIASPNPDGLEKSAEQISTTEDTSIFESPLPDYTFEPLGKYGEIVALILGILVTLAIGYLVAMLIRRRNPPEVSK